MPVPTDITAGTLTITNGSTAVTGVGTSWLASDLREGDVLFWIEGGDGFQMPILAGVPSSNTSLTLIEPWPGPTLSGARYRIRYQWDSSRVSAQSRQLIERLDNGNILSLASLTGPGVPVFDGPHNLVIKSEQDFINGIDYDVQVNTLADRAAYDGQAAGYTVLVSDVGDGRSAIYSKASNASGDWTAPAYVTGPVGPLVTIEAGTTTTLPPGSSATFDVVPVSGGYELNTGIPSGEGFVSRGVYSGATAYVKGDVVQNNNSSWIAKIATTGNAPPVLPTTSNTWWELLAAKGMDGTGTGDVVGPTSAANNSIAGYDGTTGKLIKQLTAAQATSYLNDFAGDSGTGGTKGLVVAPAAGDASAGKVLSAAGGWVAGAGKGYLFGMNTSTASTDTVTIAAGEATSSDGLAVIKSTAPMTKLITANWVAGNNNGGLDTGTVANSTYHVFAIRNPTTLVVDFLFSLSVSAPTLPSGFTQFRRLASITRVSGAIVPYTQYGDYFELNAQILFVDAVNPGTAAVTRTAPCPTGLVLSLQLSGHILNNSTGTNPNAAIITALNGEDTTPAAGGRAQMQFAAMANALNAATFSVMTNTSGQFRSRMAFSDSHQYLRIVLIGWTDTRGRT